MKRQSKRLFERREILIEPEQNQDVQSDADARYPELITPKGNRRNFSPAMRDIIDFWRAHRPLFLTWLTTRRDLTTPGQEQPQ